MVTLPKKLKHDAIVEALVELRFEHKTVGEVIVGRLVAAAGWKDYHAVRLPVADLPAEFRDANPDLRYQPIIQLQRPVPGEIIKIGSRVISLHVLSPYPGWGSFSERISALIEDLYSAVPDLLIQRVGLRYINAITPGHGLSSIAELNYNLEVGGAPSSNDLSIALRTKPSEDVQCQVMIAAPSFVNGSVPSAVAYIDLDMSTPTAFGSAPKDVIFSWLDGAHNFEKEAFFALWPEAVLEKLREE